MSTCNGRRRDVPGTIYLIHFETPLKHAKHYLGWTEGDVSKRLWTHCNGDRGGPSKLVQAVRRAGIRLAVVRTWRGTRRDERRMKQRGKSRMCPVCKGTIPENEVAYE